MNIPFVAFVTCVLYTPLAQCKTLHPPCKGKTPGVVCERDGFSGLCYSNECVFPSKTPVVVKLRYQQNNSHLLKYVSPSMWLRGNGLGLSWDKGKQMRKSSEKDTWELLINFTIPIARSSFDTKKKLPGKFEFRAYLDDTKDMLGANFILPLALSTDTKHLSRDIPVAWFYPWFFRQTGTVRRRTIYSPELGEYRNITVYMPPSFSENIHKRYETMFVNDGQRLEQMIPQTDALIVKKALLKEVILVGIFNAWSKRTALLAPSNGTNVQCKYEENDCKDMLLRCSIDNPCSYQENIQIYRKCCYWVPIPKVYGQIYLDFIQNTLIPETKKSYRSLAGAENFGIRGFSFGGLVACHAMWTRPHTFGSAACLSPSLWWPFPVNGTFPDDAGYEFVTSTLLSHRDARPKQKLYIDVGSEEGGIMIDPARNTTRILAKTSYFELNKNLWFYIWDNQYHYYQRNMQRFWASMMALYGAEGSPSSISNTATSLQIGGSVHVFTIQVALIGFLQMV